VHNFVAFFGDPTAAREAGFCFATGKCPSVYFLSSKVIMGRSE